MSVRPRIGLVGSILRANARALTRLGRPVAAVVKSDAYGWGATRVAREIDSVVESYVVGDETEFWELRPATLRPIRLLAPVRAARIVGICLQGGIPNVTTCEGIDAAAGLSAVAERPVTVRIGIVDSAGWSGIAPQDAAAVGARCAGAGLRVELWTHITSATRQSDALRAFAACVAAFTESGATIAGTDVASTAWASADLAGTRTRIGAGLFGARLGAVADLRCAIRVDAPVVDWFAPGKLGWAGYGDIAIPVHRGVAVLRCGYGDGLPKKLAGDDDILSVGMQYTIRLADNPTREHALIDDSSDLDRLADRLGVGPHELITGLAQHT